MIRIRLRNVLLPGIVGGLVACGAGEAPEAPLAEPVAEYYGTLEPFASEGSKGGPFGAGAPLDRMEPGTCSTGGSRPRRRRDAPDSRGPLPSPPGAHDRPIGASPGKPP